MRLSRTLKSLLIGSLCSGFCLAATATEVRLLGIFTGRVLVSIDGAQKIIKQNEPTAQGVTLLETGKNEAVLLIDGQQQTLSLGTTSFQSSGFAKPAEGKTVQVVKNNLGMYATVGSINGQTVNMLVDTGATTIALNAVTAKNLGIPFRLKGQKTMVSTASGTANAYAIKLDRVKVGQIELRNVDAVVVDGTSPEITLLGMSFLGQLSILHESNKMIMKKKY